MDSVFRLMLIRREICAHRDQKLLCCVRWWGCPPVAADQTAGSLLSHELLNPESPHAGAIHPLNDKQWGKMGIDYIHRRRNKWTGKERRKGERGETNSPLMHHQQITFFSVIGFRNKVTPITAGKLNTPQLVPWPIITPYVCVLYPVLSYSACHR